MRSSILKRKVIFGFILSTGIIAVLLVFEYISFLQVKNETALLEITDTIRTKSLQLRRHEKNYFLYLTPKELDSIHRYIGELNQAVGEGKIAYHGERFMELEQKVEQYREHFAKIEAMIPAIRNELALQRKLLPRYEAFFPLMESTFLENPLLNARQLQIMHPSGAGRITAMLTSLEAEIDSLRKLGEDIIALSKELDKAARGHIDGFISQSQNAIIILFPVFFFVGIGFFYIIINDVIRRLHTLAALVEKAEREGLAELPLTNEGMADKDEVDILIRKFESMEQHLAQRERELLDSKKLAAIGTLASGIAHEINNPLNNIHTTAQRLQKKTGAECPQFLRQGLDDIFGETNRVRGIVRELLDFAKGRDLRLAPVDLDMLLKDAYASIKSHDIALTIDTKPQGLRVQADVELLRQVFINLFTNSAEAMPDGGKLSVRSRLKDKDFALIEISDTGGGIPADIVEKVFEPFFTSKEKGTGLGLAIVYNIIRKHQGDIKVHSIEGRGTTFRITLPLAVNSEIEERA